MLKAIVRNFLCQYFFQTKKTKNHSIRKSAQIFKLYLIGKIRYLSLKEDANKSFLPIPSEVIEELDGMLGKVQVRFE